jgi:hypothetical protein
MRWRVQTWLGDSWSYGTGYYSEAAARRAAAQLRGEGWRVRVVPDRRR